ncbi:hypothetical protein GCM10027416_08140 [Okibacterium endophyticum]
MVAAAFWYVARNQGWSTAPTVRAANGGNIEELVMDSGHRSWIWSTKGTPRSLHHHLGAMVAVIWVA